MHLKQEQIVGAVKRAGVVGAGGGGFPSWFKLSAKADTVVANGSECEPLLATDKTVMKMIPAVVIDGLKIAMNAVGAKRGIIAIKEHNKDVIASISKELPSDGSITLHRLNNYYPAGDEFLLVFDTTGRVIPEGGIPLSVGVIVNNVVTLAQISRAVAGKPVTERVITVTGEVKEPKVITVPIGTKYSDVIKFAGGTTISDAVIIDGGPMMGKIIENLGQGIAKTTSAIIALPPDHIIVQNAKKPLSQIAKQSKSACCQCFRCTDMCPRNLIGHEIHPHMTMRTIDYGIADAKNVTSAFLCSQCGMCELIACDIMRLSPRRIFGEYKRELLKRGVKSPHVRKGFPVRSQYQNTKVSTGTVLKKLDLVRYNFGPKYEGEMSPDSVRIPIAKHTGSPAIPSVHLRQKVKMTDVIAASPEDKLGAVYHASMAGQVTDITDYWIEISQ